MWAIYKYNLRKYIKSPSTWVILVLSCFIAGFLGGYLPYSKMNTESYSIAKDYAKTTVTIVAAMTSFLSIFVSIFAGFKASSMYKDEVEDGTFLVMLSKPITRAQIIFGKWIALQSSILVFTLLTSFTFTISTFVFDKGDTILALETLGIDPIKRHIFMVGTIMWGIIMLMGLIFSSIALLISTRLSVGTTIGFSIAIGIIIQVTTLIAMFTKKDEYTSLSSPRISWYTNKYNRLMGNINNIDQRLRPKEDIGRKFHELEKSIVESPLGMYNIGVETKEKDSFGAAWPFDIDFQLHKLSEYASNVVVPEDIRTSLATGSGEMGNFGIEGISNKLIPDNPLSKNSTGFNSPNADFNYIKNAALTELPKVFKVLTEWAHYQWWALEQAVVSKNLVPELISNKLFTSRLLQQVIHAFPVDKDADLTDRTILQQIFDADQQYAKDNSLPLTPLGYEVGTSTTPVTMPADDVLAHEWWINWYKLSQEVAKNHEISHPSTVPGAHPEHWYSAKYKTLFDAMRSVYSSSYNLLPGEKRTIYTINGRERQLNDINGITESMGAQRAYIVATTLLSHDIPKALLSEGHTNEANIINIIGNSLSETSRPLGIMFFEWVNLKGVMDQYAIKPYPRELTREMLNTNHTNLAAWANTDLDVMSNILGIAYARPDLLLKIESRDYVHKETILYVYLAIALVLVPISYLIVRRQDFR